MHAPDLIKGLAYGDGRIAQSPCQCPESAGKIVAVSKPGLKHDLSVIDLPTGGSLFVMVPAQIAKAVLYIVVNLPQHRLPAAGIFLIELGEDIRNIGVKLRIPGGILAVRTEVKGANICIFDELSCLIAAVEISVPVKHAGLVAGGDLHLLPCQPLF